MPGLDLTPDHYLWLSKHRNNEQGGRLINSGISRKRLILQTKPMWSLVITAPEDGMKQSPWEASLSLKSLGVKTLGLNKVAQAVEAVWPCKDTN